MYAPLVLHFNSYGVGLNPTATTYMRHVLDDADVGAWMADVLRETEIIAECEAGQDLRQIVAKAAFP